MSAAAADCHLLCVAPDMAAQFWPHVAPMIEAAYASADETMPETLLDDLAAKQAQLWIAYTDAEKILAALVTRLIKYRSGWKCKCVACGGGGIDRWKRFYRQIEQFAKAEGCVAVLAEGRGGWAGVLPNYRKVSVTLEKRL